MDNNQNNNKFMAESKGLITRKRAVAESFTPGMHRKKKRSDIQKIWMNYDIFHNCDKDQFKKQLFDAGKLKFNTHYGVLVKVRRDDIFITATTRQFCMSLEGFDDIKIDMFFEQINDSIERLFDEYQSELDYTCDAVLLDFLPVTPNENFITTKISNIKQIKGVVSESTSQLAKSRWSYFGGFNINDKGFPLRIVLKEGALKLIGLEDKVYMEKFCEFFKTKIVLHKDKNYLFNRNSKFYLVDCKGKDHIIITDKITEDITLKRCFNSLGQFIYSIVDIKLSKGNWRRKCGNTIINFNSRNEIVTTEKRIDFNSIKSDFNSKLDKGLPNTNIGVLDLETYESDSIGYCYAIGFMSSIDDKVKTFYIDRDLDSNKLIHSCFSELLRPRYKNIIFYIHNLGRFDAPFIIKALSEFNQSDEGKANPYTFDCITRKRDILKLIIRRRIEGKIRRVVLHDSVGILPRKLRDLCKDFNVKTHKGFFPYNFCNKHSLFYVGETPNINYYNDLLDDDELLGKDKETIDRLREDKYKSIFKNNWSLQEECINYLEKDLKSLYEVLIEFSKTLYMLFDVQMIENLTISGISMKIFFAKYYSSKKNPLPLINNRLYYNDIHKAYYGGRVEVYNPTIEKNSTAYYYDVNSLYPFASIKNPLPGLQSTYIETISKDLDIKSLFGFFYCKVESGNRYLGLLPYRTEKNSLLFPVGSWEGWYFSEEIKFAAQHGYKIRIIKGYRFNKSYNVFDDFVTDIYKIKSNPRNKSEKTVAKLLLNGIIGKFGMDFLKQITQLLDKEKYNKIAITRILRDSIEIDDNLYLDTYKPSIDKDVCYSFDLDFAEVLNSENYDENISGGTYKNVSITTAAAVLSYARIHMAKIMLYILSKGGKIYYSDTDSIVTDLKLPQDLVDPTEIGKLKLEYEISTAYFIADKTYVIVTTEGIIIKKAKGVDSNYLVLDDYIKMYNMESINYAKKTSSFKDFAKGSVTISMKNNIKLNPQFYNKRRRVFTTNPTRWIRTSPIIVGDEKIKRVKKNPSWF